MAARRSPQTYPPGDDRQPGAVHRHIRYAPPTVPTRRNRRRLTLPATEHGVRPQPAACAFFDDVALFARLSQQVIPELVRRQPADLPLRLWIAGCGTGEEAYSLAILFREEIDRQQRDIRLQLFASDIDAAAIATCREAVYPDSIAGTLSKARLRRFFVRQAQGYRVQPDLRACVLFTVQDLLIDPPFSRIDLIACRKLLRALAPRARSTLISLFHFALRDEGILLLDKDETAGNDDNRFTVIAGPGKIYRRVSRSLQAEVTFSLQADNAARLAALHALNHPPSRRAGYDELCRRQVFDRFAPASALINQKNECLHTLGPTERFLHVAAGRPSNDFLAMLDRDLRARLRPLIRQAWQSKGRMLVDGGQIVVNGVAVSLQIELQPLQRDQEKLLLVCFLEREKPRQPELRAASDQPRVVELEQELAVTRAELQGAQRVIELAAEEHLAVNEEAMSVNEELLNSKEQLQSLNEELTALNSQLHDTLDRQRTTANDLQNVLYSSDVATLFLDTRLRIRFFTPTTRALFKVIPGDLGRPLADLSALTVDDHLLIDAETVLRTLAPIEREVEALGGAWYMRRILPYRTQDNGIEGVVITFTDITERRHIADVLAIAKQQADLANNAKSRFLAAASHDLRQPLQTLALLQGLLAKSVSGDKLPKLVARLGDALGAMSGMLNTLLDINQIEAGTVKAERARFPVQDLLQRLCDEFTYPAEAQGLQLRSVRCSLLIDSDPRLLEQILRNLLANALKYTRKGKVLVGCRRRHGKVRIEIWDTGIGIADEELLAIFDEYHQLGNDARERSRGLGLGLSIVRRLTKLLDHRISVQSRPGKGSVFSVEVGGATPPALPQTQPSAVATPPLASERRNGAVLVVEDDPDLCDLLQSLLTEEGHFTAAAHDGNAALKLLERGAIRPDLLLADFNLPDGLNGLQLAARVRAALRRNLPVVILTGDIATTTEHDIAQAHCAQLNKPVKLSELTAAIQRLLPQPPAALPPRGKPLAPSPADPDASAVIFVVDDDNLVRHSIRALLEDSGHRVLDFDSCESFLAADRPGGASCLLIDAYLPGMKGLELLRRLNQAGESLPTIMITGNSDVPMAVQAMKSGASDFLEKPFSPVELLSSVSRALDQARDAGLRSAWQSDAAGRVACLTPRQHEIMELVLAGHPSKNIAADLRISQRTVENHRASIMEKTGSKSLPALARLAMAAAQGSSV